MKKALRHAASKVLKGNVYNKAVLPKHYAVALEANIRRKYPARGLTVIGVTGTNGKTSTCFMIHRMLLAAGYNAGLITTVSYGVGDDLQPQTGHMTSQPIGLLLDRIQAMKDQGMDILVLEVTSHALAQYRMMGVPIDMAVFTNLTQDHLDYHGSFEAYRNSKLKLFKQAANNQSGRQLGIINMGDPNAHYFAAEVPHVMGYSLEPTDGAVHPENIELTPLGSSYDTEINGHKLHITCNITGRFNIANSLAAACVGVALGLKPEDIEKGIASLSEIDGRMTRVEAGQDFTVLVDFAHTPDALEKVLSAAGELTHGKVRAVFGATGDRDKTKRPIMGRIAAKHADMIYLTDDETYTENPEAIRAGVRAGIEEAGGEYVEIGDRLEAIKQALSDAETGDVVVLAGIGHEDSRNMGGKLIPWNEKDIVKEVVTHLKKHK